MAKIPKYDITEAIRHNIKNPEYRQIKQAEEILRRHDSQNKIPKDVKKKKRRD